MVRRKAQKTSRRRIEGAQAVGRAIEVLCAVAKCQRSGATLAKIMSVTALSRSTAFRLLHYLAEARLLDFDERQRCYYVGPLTYELGLAARGHADLVANWRDRMELISAKTGLTTYLVARSDMEGVCLATAHGPSVIRSVPLMVGQRLPLGIGAGSLAILSSLPDIEVDTIIAAHGPKLRMYSGGRLTPKVLRQYVETTRTKGYAFSQNNLATGVLAVGVRIPGDDELTQLAVGVSAVATHMSEAEQAQIAKTIRKIIYN
jgi:DNA-binding IclR family transcriptional regulator